LVLTIIFLSSIFIFSGSQKGFQKNDVVQPSTIPWAQLRLDGKRIGCYAVTNAVNPRVAYPAIASSLVARGANLTDITNAMKPVQASLLAHYDLLWFDAGTSGLITGIELTALDTWVQGGGSVLCTGDDSSSPADDVASHFGPYWTTTSPSTGVTSNIFGHPITQGVTSVWYSGSTWMPNDDLYSNTCIVANYDDVAAANMKGSGKLVYICDGIFQGYGSASNSLLINNTFGWLLFSNKHQPTLSTGSVTPSSGPQNTLFNFSISYTDLDNNQPMYINITVNGTSAAMQKANPADFNYTNGCTYYYTRYLQPGSYTAQVSANDGNYTVTSTITGPTVSYTSSSPPVIQSESVSPSVGTNSTFFNFSTRISDADNSFPKTITVLINGTAYPMQQVNPNDFNIMDGKDYALLTRLSFGKYNYRINCSDGTSTATSAVNNGPTSNPFYGKSPWYTPYAPQGSVFTGNVNFKWNCTQPGFSPVYYTWQLSNTSTFASILQQQTVIPQVIPTTSITANVDYPSGTYYWRIEPTYTIFIGNWSGTQSFTLVVNHNSPVLSIGQVNPSAGDQSKFYNFTVLYTDADNNAPFYMNVSINGVAHAMQKANPSDNLYTDGAFYSYATYFTPNTYAYSFTCSDGKYLTSTSVNILVVSLTNAAVPRLTNPSVTPAIANNATMFNFTVTYIDSDNNLPQAINITINGTVHAMLPASADLNVMDGKVYYYAALISTPGKYTCTMHCWDGLYSNSTGPFNHPEVNPFAPIFPLKNVAIFQDTYPWGYSTVETILASDGISYTIYPGTSLGKVGLGAYNKVIISSEQSTNFYGNLTSPAVRSWLEAFASAGGTVEINAAATNNINGLPGGYNVTYYTTNSVTINSTYASNPIVVGITGTGIDGWGYSAHTYITNVKLGDQTLVQDTSSPFYPRLIESRFGSGLIFVTGMTLEYGAGNNLGQARQLLQNLLVYNNPLGYSAIPIVPVNGIASFDRNITFTWSRMPFTVPNTVNYTWQLSNSSSFSIILNQISKIPSASFNTTQVITVNYTTGMYYWRVQPSYNTLLGNWSMTSVIKLTRNDKVPTLASGQVNPVTGNQQTPFNFTVMYADADNNVPQYVRLTVNGTIYAMTKVHPANNNYAAGCQYQVTTTLPIGVYGYSFSCFDGIFSANTSMYSLAVTVVNNFAPVLNGVAFTPPIGDNWTLFNVTVVYTDADNNPPASIGVILNGTIIEPMVQVNPAITSVTSGKQYEAVFSLPNFGNYTFRINASDGLHQVSTASFSGPSVNPFYGYGQLGKVGRVALFLNANPYNKASVPEETILAAQGIPYTVFTSSSIGSANLTGFDKVFICGGQASGFYSNFYSAQSWFANYINQGGVVVIEGEGTNIYSLTLPFGFALSSDSTTNLFRFNATYANHPVIAGVNATSFAYTPLYNEYITGMKKGDLILASDPVNKNYRIVVASRGYGLLVICTITAELAYMNGNNTRLLQNLVTYTRRAVQPLSPANGTSIYSGYQNFRWATIPAGFGPFNYTFQLSNSVSFASILAHTSMIGSGNMSYLLDVNYTTSGYYYWRVGVSYGVYKAPWKANLNLYERYDNFPVVVTQFKVTPTIGLTGSSFNFSLYYSDKDNSPPNYVWLYVNGTYAGWLQQLHSSNTNFTVPVFYSYAGVYYTGTYPYYVTVGDYNGRPGFSYTSPTYTFRARSNNAPILSAAQEAPSSGNSSSNFTFSVTYTDADNDTPSYVQVVVDGSPYAMVKQNMGDNTYTDGCVYVLSKRFTAGTHNYYFACSDGMNSTTTTTGSFITIAVNIYPPTLQNPAVTPTLGNPITIFNFTIRYTDQDNNFPASITITINGTQHSMQQSNPADTDMTDGKDYMYSTTLPVLGQYHFQINCSDGLHLASTSVINMPSVIYIAPTLSSDQVVPTSGPSTIPFNFSVAYTDAENHAPAYINVIVGGNSYAMIKQNSGDNIYTDGCVYVYVSLFPSGLYSYYFTCSDGFLTALSGTKSFNVTVVNNYPPQLQNPSVTPQTGNPTTIFNFTARYVDQDNNFPSSITVSINGTIYTMQASNPSDTNVIDGKIYMFSTTLPTLGQYHFQINCSDGLHFASTGVISMPLVNYIAPTLTADQVNPPSGFTANTFNFSVVYTDAENYAPSYIHVVLDGVTDSMVKQNSLDTTYSDGCMYMLAMTFSAGQHSFYFECSDGNVNETSITKHFTVILNNYAPQLLYPAVTPESGNTSTLFTFSVRYIDLDNNLPVSITISINGTLYSMQPTNLSDTDVMDGKDYTFSTTFPYVGHYSFQISCSDGLFSANTALISGPSVTRSNTQPSNQPSFFEQYGLYVVIGALAIAAIAITPVVVNRSKKAKKAKITKQVPRKQMIETVVPKKAPGKAFPSKTGASPDVPQPMTAEAVAELQKTEQEVTAQMDVKLCIVHKGPIKGASYACPQCSTFYCLGCAATLARNGEGCWSCGHKIELDEALAAAGTKQIVPAESMKFYCNHCAQYHDMETIDLDAWANCPVCSEPMVYVKPCMFCSQPIALSKELYSTYKGKLMQCPNCNKNVTI